jgi:predicted methyltransferase
VRVDPAVLPDQETLRRIAADQAVVYRLEPRGPARVQRYDESTGGFYKLVPTTGAPTIEISGVRMHRTKDVTPWQDTEAKLATIRPVVGRVLDTTTGLGYTAILAARTAEHVLTIERDPGVVAIAAENPWSRELFESPRIERRIGDAAEVVPTLPAASFDRVVHDPPTIALAGELYGLAFYEELLRVLRPGGRLFHYTGTPGRARGLDLPARVAARLRKVGFDHVRLRPEALGVSASAP